jgi:GT2 family glycosyltransferase
MTSTRRELAMIADAFATARVYAVVPVFNRWEYTRTCVELLAAQSHRAVTVIVSDGGSTDGTRDKLAGGYPDVIVAYDGKERWWTGSTALGIDRALETATDDDFILMINNDTLIPPDYVETLVRVSRRENAAVGAKVVDSRDPSVVLDAGEFVNWASYDFPVRTAIPEGELFFDGVDVLPGRGSLVPVPMIRKAGNVDDAGFPHYLADYEFFCRLKANGFRLGISYETAILAHIEETGIQPAKQRTSIRAVWKELTSRRSMTNVRDHWRFVDRHAPPAEKARIKRLLVARAGARLLLGTWLAVFMKPLVKVWIHAHTTWSVLAHYRGHRAVDPNAWKIFYSGPRWLLRLAQVTTLPRPLSAEEIAGAGGDPAGLLAAGIVEPHTVPGWFMLTTTDPSDHESAGSLGRLASVLSAGKLRRMREYSALVRAWRAADGRAGAAS